jgi:diadenosine tetraphosphate (Ap4A) HIT family hydrolase
MCCYPSCLDGTPSKRDSVHGGRRTRAAAPGLGGRRRATHTSATCRTSKPTTAARDGRCFVCAIVARYPQFCGHHVVYEDGATIAFLTKHPTQYGYTLACPKEHREQATADFSAGEYLTLQRAVHRVAEAVREEVGAERMYVLTLGSNQGNAHVHWHVVPLPPGVPYEGQQYAALMLESAGALSIPEEEKASLAARISGRIRQAGRD